MTHNLEDELTQAQSPQPSCGGGYIAPKNPLEPVY